MKSVLQDEKKCYICQTAQWLEEHHIFFGTSNRKQSEAHGMKVYLCNHHHTGSNESVHHNREMDICLKQMAQFYYECHIGTRREFMRVFGKSYL